MLSTSSSVTARATATARRVSLIALAAAAIGVAACASKVNVRTQVAPDASLSGLQTFRILPTPPRRVDATSAYSSDPMLANSITNHALVDDLRSAFEGRGYVLSTDSPDFTVAYYASTREKLDITNWDYGYRWHRWPRDRQMITQYTEGTVVVDVIDPGTNELLWRGQGVASVSDDPGTYAKELNKTVAAIVKRFPTAAQHASAARWTTPE
jgi:hypothetical protein